MHVSRVRLRWCDVCVCDGVIVFDDGYQMMLMVVIVAVMMLLVNMNSMMVG